MSLADDLCEKMFSLRPYTPEHQNHIRNFIYELDDETVLKATSLMGYGDLGYEVGVLVEHYHDAARLNEYMRFAPVLYGPTTKESTREFIPSLHGYKSLEEHEDYSKADSAVQRQCEALLRVSFAYSRRTQYNFDMRDSYSYSPLHFPLQYDNSIRENELVNHLLEHPEDDTLIANIIFERNIMPWDEIKPFLPTLYKPVPLLSGML